MAMSAIVKFAENLTNATQKIITRGELFGKIRSVLHFEDQEKYKEILSLIVNKYSPFI